MSHNNLTITSECKLSKKKKTVRDLQKQKKNQFTRDFHRTYFSARSRRAFSLSRRARACCSKGDNDIRINQ